MPPRFPKQCAAPCSEAVVRHGGPSSASAVPIGPREATFRTRLDQALAEEDLCEVYRLWSGWIRQGSRDVPLDNRELAVVRRRAAGIARAALRAAVRSEEVGILQEALKEADSVEGRWPYPVGVKRSLEYQAAQARLLQAPEGPEQAEPQRRTLRRKAEEQEEDQSTSGGSSLGDEAARDGEDDWEEETIESSLGGEEKESWALLEENLHKLILGRIGRLPDGWELPKLVEMVEELKASETVGFSVPGMAGGFSVCLDDVQPSGPVLVVESHSRFIEGSEKRFIVTTKGAELVAEGFFELEYAALM